MRLRTGAGDLQLPERREVIQQRLTDLMVATNTPRMDVDVLPASAAPVRTVQAGENYNVYANDMLIVTVTKADAVANKTTVYKQAKQWADRLVEVYPVTFAKADPMGPSR